MSSSVYTTYVDNLHNFVTNLPKTNIYFLYFMQKNMIPKVKCTFGECTFGECTFGEWSLGTDKNYVLPGIDHNFAYVYKDDSLKLLVDPYPNSPSPFNAQFVAHAPTDTEINVIIKGLAHAHISDPNEVFLGHHIDFNIIEMRIQKQIIRCHLTAYNLSINNKFIREETPCNFTMQDVNPNYLNDINEFKKIACEPRIGSISSGYNMTTFCDSKWHNIVFNLTRITKGLTQLGGNKLQKQKYSYNKKLYTIHNGKRGESYIMVNNHRKYLKNKQSGGTLPEQRKKLIESEEFSDLIYNTFYAPLSSHKNKLEGMQFIYDSENEISEKGSENMVIIYEFAEYNIQIYSINAEYIFQMYGSKSDDKLKQLSDKIASMII
jgi:hypothetical protein